LGVTDLDFGVSGIQIRIYDLRFMVQQFRVSSFCVGLGSAFRLKVQRLGFRVWGLCFMVYGLWLRVYSIGFRV
jgi:hypothetical protein